MIDLNYNENNSEKNQISDIELNSGSFFRIALIGDSGVGKTSIVQCCRDGISDLSPHPTIGVDYIIKHYKLEDKSNHKFMYNINKTITIFVMYSSVFY